MERIRIGFLVRRYRGEKVVEEMKLHSGAGRAKECAAAGLERP